MSADDNIDWGEAERLYFQLRLKLAARKLQQDLESALISQEALQKCADRPYQ